MTALLASIPSPSSGSFQIFSHFTIHMYGVMLVICIAGCIGLTGDRWVRWGGDLDLIFRMSLWGVIAGIIGARAYHDLTSWNQDQTIHQHWYGFAAVWDGGLGIWGAIPVGCLAGAWIVRRSGQSVRLMMDAVAPGLLLAQGIGRWGNYFNQELFGKPSTLPWALEIAPSHRPAGYAIYSTFQPTFLYESLACLAIVGILLLAEHRGALKLGQTFALYVALYTFARFWFENMRIDPAHEIAGLRLNAWLSILVCLSGIAWFFWLGRHEPLQRRPGHSEPAEHPVPAPQS